MQLRAVAAETSTLTDRARKTSDHFSSGQVEAFRPASRRRGCFERVGQVAAPGHRSTVWISRRGNERRARAAGCCEHRGHSDQVGVRARRNRLSRTAARRPRLRWRRPGPACVRRVVGSRERHRFVSTVVPGLIDAGFPQSVAGAPPCGLFARASHSRASRLARAHSWGRITPGCT